MRPGPIRSSAWEIATVLSALAECPPAAMRWPLAGLLLALLPGGPSAPAQPLAAATGRGPPREPCGRTAAGVSAVPAVCGWSMAGSGRAPCDGAAAPAVGCAQERGLAEQRPLPRHWGWEQWPEKLPGVGVVRQPAGSGQGPQYKRWSQYSGS